MTKNRAFFLGWCLLGAFPGFGQTTVQKDRIHGPIDPSRRIVLSKVVQPNARAEFDAGPVDPGMKLGYIQMILKPSEAQQAALETLLEQQQDPASPNYHKWLTPDQFADRFGASARDMQQVQTWLASQGFTLIQTARARNWIAFSATAGQIQNALRTEIRHYRVNGELHYANATAPSIPAALEPVVLGFVGLDDFRVKVSPLHAKPLGDISPGSIPQYTSSGVHALAPADLATIYDVNPLYTAGITGSGQKIVIIGLSDIYVQDIRTFRSTFGLPAKDPELILVPGSTDPGVNSDPLGEADLDLETSGGIAPAAELFYVYSTNIIFSVNYAIDQNLAPVISMSLGVCEALASSYGIGVQYVEPYAQQAASQGITIVDSSGDVGAAMCDAKGDPNNPAATHGLAVNLFSTPAEVTSVGGTEFDDANGNYWASANNSSGGSALGYIPESGWNESSPTVGMLSTGGGISSVYPKPAWQNGAGFPSANARAIPDVSLDAAVEHDPYIIYTNGGYSLVGGTSASAPAFAGMLALLNQYLNSSGQGNINPNLYRLAQSGASPFHDITTGNNIVPCVALSPDCTNGSLGYSAGPGFDLVTGWGTVDLARMATGWTASQLQATISVSANPPSVPQNGSTTLTARVTAVGSSANPTGTVTFLLGNTSLGANLLTASGSGVSTATLTVYASELPAGSDVITVIYSGDKTFTSSSTRFTLGVSGAAAGTSVVLPSVSPNPVYEQTADSDGYSWFYTVRLTEIAGVSTTLTGFTITVEGFALQDYSSDIASFFGSSQIRADGTLAASLRTKLQNVPSTLIFGFSGMDASGATWTQQITVNFFGPQLSAYISLTGLPNDVKENPNGNNGCPTADPWLQYLGLEEDNGHAVYLTKFLAGGIDLSDQIADFFGATYIPPFGSLLGGICWHIGSPPTTLSYEVDGVDDAGNNVFTTLNTLFEGPVSNPGTLAPTASAVTMTVGGSAQSATATLGINVSQGQTWSVSMFPQNRTTSWLVVYPLSGTGPATLNISASSAGLAAGLYQATLVFQSINAIPESYNVPVNFVVGSPVVSQVINSGILTDFPNQTTNTPLAPGLIFTVRGTGLGPQYGLNYFIDSTGKVTKNIGGIQVFVDGYPCPLLYVSQTQINAIAPYEIAGNVGQLANVQVFNNGVAGNIATDQIAATAPGIFNIGNNQAAALNSDYSVNGPGNPAAKGSTVFIFATGEGQLNPAGVDGSLATTVFPRPIAPVSVSLANIPATNLPYYGTVGGSFEGFFQVNVQIPTTVPSGTIPVVITVGGVSSPPLNIVVQ